jgi:hypothetical protein
VSLAGEQTMRILVLVGAMVALIGVATENWTIFRNCNSDPCIIGVALPSCAEPGWDPIATCSGPQKAWAVACELHRQGGTT